LSVHSMHSFAKLVLIAAALPFANQVAFASNNTLIFPSACSQGNTLLIAAVGDVLLHQPLQVKASQSGFESIWQAAIPYIQKADIAYANLEGPMAAGITRDGNEVKQGRFHWDNKIYSSFPLFNYHPNLATALKTSGFDLVSTANNHALDRFSIGIDKTIDALNQAGLSYTGTRKKDDNGFKFTILTRNGFRIAWIACAEHTNGMTDHYQQVLHCFKNKDRQWLLQSIQTMKNQVDAIIVFPHWGEQYQHYPNSRQTQFAHQLAEAGATAVIGSHPHVLQTMEKYITKDGRATFIAYSLGNFVSYQGTPKNRTSAILFLGLTKNSQHTIINGIRFVPLYMQNRSGLNQLHLTVLPSNDRYSIAYQIISRILPVGNIAYSQPIITNPQCH